MALQVRSVGLIGFATSENERRVIIVLIRFIQRAAIIVKGLGSCIARARFTNVLIPIYAIDETPDPIS